MHKLLLILIFIPLLAPLGSTQTAPPANPQLAASADDNTQLRQELDQMKKQVAALEERLAAQEKAAQEKKDQAAAAQTDNSDLTTTVKDLDHRVAQTERRSALDRINFSGDYRFEDLMPNRRELEQLSKSGINPEKFAIRSEEAGMLRAAIQKLPPQYRIVLVLRDMEGLSDEEVAEITGLRGGTVRVRLHRARLSVRKELMKRAKPKPETRSKGHDSGGERDPTRRPARCKAMFAELSDYLDEKLDDSLCDELEQHLEGCAPCQLFLESLKATIEGCRNLPSDDPVRSKARRLRQELMKHYTVAQTVLREKR